MARTERESDRRRREENDRHVGAAEISKERAEWRRLQRKHLSILGLPKRKEWSQCHRESSWQECCSRPCQKEKEQSYQFKAPDHEWERVKVGESLTLAREREGSEQEHEEERVDSTVKEGRFQSTKGRASKKSLSRSRRKHEWVSGRKSSPVQSAESWFHSKSGQT